MAAATATAMYLLLKVAIVTKSRQFLFARNLTRRYPAWKSFAGSGQGRNVDLFRRKILPTFL